MSDAPQPLFFRKVARKAKRSESAVCALLFDPQEALPVSTARLSWHGLIGGRFRELARAAQESGKPEGKSLPYASLRAAIQVQLPDTVMLSRDLGRPWSREDGGAFMQVAEDTAGDSEVRLCGVLRTWVGMVLRPWAERLELDDALVDSIDDACSAEVAVTKEHGQPDLLRSIEEGQVFDRLRHPVLQEVSRRLEGLELFPGLGPVFRVVRSRSKTNEVHFQTWPATANSGGLYSMVASFALETVPYLDRPLLTVRASRRRWLDDLPSTAKLRRQRTLTGYLMGRSPGGNELGGPLAVEFTMSLRSGVPEEPSSPEYLHQVLAVRADLAKSLAEMVQARGQDVFLGLPYSPQRDGKARVGAGASTRDQLDLLDAVAQALAPMGMRPLPFEEAATRRNPKRSVDFHKALEAEGLVAEFAVALGSNELDQDDLLEAARLLMDGGAPPPIDPDTAEKGRRILESLQDANWQRIRRAFGDSFPTIVIVARRESERLLMRAAINGLFGPRIAVVDRQLPRNVHGPRASLPESDKKARLRFAARVEAWGELAADLSTSYEGCHALVQAEKWYENKHDDEVNLPAGRHALAMTGNANVQYLLPAESGWRGLARYLHRIQAAVYDLLFGHSALVSEIRSLVDADFPDESSRPKSVIGISLVTQARLRNGGQGGQLCLASRIDVRTGRTEARIGWFEQVMQWSPDWVPFFEAMKQIASCNAATLGQTIDVRRRSYQSFVAEVIDGAVADGDRPLVLLDSTSAAELWPWLTDAKIGGAPSIGPESIDKSQEWAAARLVRIRCGRAARVLERTTVRYETYDGAQGGFGGERIRYCPSAVAKTVELPHGHAGTARHYWVTSGYFQATRPRGLSVYRALDTFVPVVKTKGLEDAVPTSDRRLVTEIAMDISDEPYRVPNAIDVTVAQLTPGDDPAAIAHLVASLRCGYGHSRLETTLPAPLFFETKARDYMARFTIEELDAEEEAGLVGGESPGETEEAEPSGAEDDELLDAVEAEEAVEVALQPVAAALAAEAGSEVAQPWDGPPGPLTLLKPWSRLLRSSLAVILVDSTSLSGLGLTGQGFSGQGLGGHGAGFDSGARRFEIPGLSSEAWDRTDANEDAGEPPAVIEAEASVQAEEKKSCWLHTIKTAVVPVPPFADADWLLSVSSLPSNNHILKDVHRHRAIIGDISGYQWPEERPFGRGAADAIVNGLSHPLSFGVIADIALLSLEKSKRRKFHPYGILSNRLQAYRWSEEIGKTGRRPMRRAEPRRYPEIVRLLTESENRRDALSLAYLEVLLTSWTKEMSDVVSACRMDELDGFMNAMAALGEEEDGRSQAFQAVWRAMHHADPDGGDASPPEMETSGPGDGEDGGSQDPDREEESDAPTSRQDEPDGEMPMAIHEVVTPDGWSSWEPVPAAPASFTAEPVAEISSTADVPDAMVVDLVSAALDDWRRALSLVAQRALEVAEVEPSEEVLLSILVPFRQARAAMEEWDAARPKLVVATPLIQRGLAVAAQLALLPRPLAFEPPTGMSAVADDAEVEQGAYAEADSLIAESEASLVEAQSAHTRCVDIGADKERLFAMFEELMASKGVVEAAMRTAATRLDAASAILAAAAKSSGHAVAQALKVAADTAETGSTDLPGAPEVAARGAATTDAPATDDAPIETEMLVDVPPPVEPVQPVVAAAMDQEDDPGFEMIEEAQVAAVGDGQAEAGAATDGGDHEPVQADRTTRSADVMPEDEAEPVEADPLRAAAAAKISELVAAQAFGAAYQLRRASDAVFPAMAEVPFSAAELRLAAMAGHVGHVAMQGSQLLERVVQAAVAVVSNSAEDDEAMLARRIILSAACVELAMFHPSLPAAFATAAIEDTTAELSEAFRDLRAAVTEGARFGSITPALLRTVGEEKEDDRYVESCRQAVLSNIDGFAKMHFNWAPANRIRAHLHMRNGVLGEYRARVEANDIAAVRAFAEEYRDRGAVMALAEKIDASLTIKPKPLDGAARERLLSAFEELSALSAEYLDAHDALTSARTSRHKTAVQRIAQAVSAGAEKAIRALEAFMAQARPLPTAACGFAIRALTRLKDAADGRFAAVGLHDHQIAVHGSLLWLPNLHYGSSWLPSPYRPEGIVNAMLDMATPPASEAPNDGAFRNAVRARVAEGSFIAARLLIQTSGFYGVDEGTRAQMADHCDANLGSWRSDLKDSLDDTRRMIDKVQRMGSLVRIDQASAIFAVLDRISPDALPAEVSLEARTEEVEPEQILDFGSARDQIQDVRDRVNGLLDGPRKALLDRLRALEGTAREADISKVRQLINAHDDLVTAGEYVGFLEDGGGLPERVSANRRFNAFFPGALDALVKLGKSSLDDVRRAIEAGADLPGGLPYSRIPPQSRPETVERLEVWRDLRRRVEHGSQAHMVQPLLDRLFTAARMAPLVLSPATNGPKLPPKTYVAEMRLSLPEDKASLLLPDFGSLVGFNYRVAIAPKLPSEGEMASLCREAGTYGTIVLVTSVIDAERRRQLQASCLEHNRRVLVLDEAILLFALSEAEFRPLTLIECAQPFSFASPYKDYGNSPVPPEMFFGRETEVRKIVDRMGSCIVYGGRRLGKTALLRHIRWQHSDAEDGGSTAVGYANIRDVGAVQNRVWEAASRDLTSIFPAPVRTAAEFRTRVAKWLDEDSKRRVLLLLDEADQFIEGDSKQQFPEFSELQRLMDNSFRRFKVVLAGLHNVTRIVRTENSPLKQIASDPQRIGPLMDKELPDAERLVTRPLSALGYEFKNRSDVWRILSHCNYYPVLVQTFCAGLLSSLMEATIRRPRGAGEITDRQVRDAIENESIRKEIEEKFAYTIREIDPRYELITCIVAEQVLRDTQSGRADEGMTAVEVLDGAATWWPVAFDHPNSLETIKDLLDEMVGLGVLRQTATGAWALRSHAILRLLGDEDHVTTRLLSFEKRPAPPAFDPRSMRKTLTLPKEEPNYPCPLTWGQEHDLAAGGVPISVVFGSALADVGYVADALRGAEAVSADGVKIAVVVRTFQDLGTFTDALRSLARAATPTLLVVDLRSPWEFGWLELASKQRAVKDGIIHIVFVGGPEHALRWVRNARRAKLPGVQLVLLQPWADAYLDHKLGDGNLPPDRFARDIRRITGGYNRPMSWVFSGFTGHNHDRFAKHLERTEGRVAKLPGLLAEIGLTPSLEDLFGRFADWADGNGRIGTEEIRDGAEDSLRALDLTAAQAIQFGVAMGLLEPLAGRPGEDAEHRAYAIVPLVLSALKQRPNQSEAA